MKTKLSFTVTTMVALLGMNVAFATSSPPVDCPNPAAIQAAGVSSNVVKVNDGWFAGRRHELYGTTHLWTFAIANIAANDAQDAYNKAVTGLKSLVFLAGPVIENGRWVCSYQTSVEGYSAFAVTPPISLAETVNYTH